uniref:Riboflavin biosynthesis protein RibD n=1 Tax=Chlorobium chlorochromatii (strain CaD3) TaxID=340177 RepID=Q3ASX9_CHLCH
MPALEHTFYMQRALELALRGAGRVSPNPMVGALLVQEGEIIGEGWHERYGEAHAEVNAIAAVTNEAWLREATLYVTLEPCSHFGKTPPCSDLIIAKQIPRVVVGCRDPFPAVAGRGIAKLRAAGIEVIEGVLEAECLQSNEAFIKSHTVGLPFVTLKLAQTLDGKLATVTGASRWITGEEARAEVHRLRSVYDAVLVGGATALADNSQLTVRQANGRNPLRVVLDRSLQLPLESLIFNHEAPTLLFTSLSQQHSPKVEALQKLGVSVHAVSESAEGLQLREVLEELHHRHILSVLVESGSRLGAALLQAGFVDKLLIFIAPKLFGGDGLSAFAPLGVTVPDEAIALRFELPRFFGKDLLLEAYINS